MIAFAGEFKHLFPERPNGRGALKSEPPVVLADPLEHSGIQLSQPTESGLDLAELPAQQNALQKIDADLDAIMNANKKLMDAALALKQQLAEASESCRELKELLDKALALLKKCFSGKT